MAVRWLSKTYMNKIIYMMGIDRFWKVESKQAPKKAQPNSREKETTLIRKEPRQLTLAYRKARDEKKRNQLELREDLKKRLLNLWRAEKKQKLRQEKSRKQSKFLEDPFRFTKMSFGDMRSCILRCPKEEPTVIPFGKMNLEAFHWWKPMSQR